jgi:tellurite resistance protein TehA-like permease
MMYMSQYLEGLKAYSLRTTALVFAMALIFILQSYFTLRLLNKIKTKSERIRHDL